MEIAIVLVFVLGYLAIAFEHNINVNKAASALLTGTICWTLYIMFQGEKEAVTEQLLEHLGDVSGILFFLLGAMTIVELIDAHDGFRIITSRIKTQNTVKLLWLISFLTFFLSAVLDNLTTTIVIVSLLRKIVSDKTLRLYFIGVTVIAANAGGAWSPIGDVTTTMLWIGGQVSVQGVVFSLLLPSVVCLLVPLLYISYIVKGKQVLPAEETDTSDVPAFERNLIFSIGLGALLFVPVFKTVTHLPPFMGILFGLGVMWVLTEWIHRKKTEDEKDTRSIAHALRRIDTPSILFFLGILLAIAALESGGQLHAMAVWLTETVGNETLIVNLLGVLSAIVDNVPLVAAAQGMYSLVDFPPDSYFWLFIAYATGTGGSILIIGSAAGVAAMGLEKIDFFWYLKRISIPALLGYIGGSLAYILQYGLMH